MKSSVFIFLFLFITINGQAQQVPDSVKLTNITPFLIADFTNVQNSDLFNPYTYSNKLKQQLYPYVLRAYYLEPTHTREFKGFSSYFEQFSYPDIYSMYKNDLGKFIPKPPDITKQYIPFEQ